MVLVISATTIFAAAANPAKERPVIRVTSEPTGRNWFTAKWELCPNGLVLIRGYDGTKRTKVIGPAKVTALLSKLERLGFYRITSRSVEESIEKFTTRVRETPKGVSAEVERLVISDCDVSTISVRRDAKTHTITFYAVEEMAEHYPKAADLKILKKALSEVYKTAGDQP